MIDLLLIALGFVILLLAGDFLVRGAVNMALRVGIPALIVSLTVVAFGTSAPELLISVQAIEDGAPGIALGNVVGSNTANILLVLGIPALLATLGTADCDTRRSYVIMLAASILFIALCFFGPLSWWHGLVLLGAFALILGEQILSAIRARGRASDANDVEDVEGADPNMSWLKIGIFLALGLIGLPMGADILVDSSVNLARAFGVSETVIGLTLIAIGTSLPELATTVMAAYRRQAEVALGNVIGSNIFNLLFIIGVALLFGDIPVERNFLTVDLWVMLAASLILIPFVFTESRNMTKRWGLLLTATYCLYLWFVVTHGAVA